MVENNCIDTKKSEKLLITAANRNNLNSIPEIENEIKKVEGALRTANLATLPDKGIKLKEKLNYLKTLHNEKTIEKSLISTFEDLKLTDTPVKTKETVVLVNTKEKDVVSDKIVQANKKIDDLFKIEEKSNKLLETLEELKKTNNIDLISPNLKGKLKTILMDHQWEALQWMGVREKCFPYGGILADDMGLGKTLTVIAHVLNSQTPKSFAQTLIICPTSLIHQWKYEIMSHVRSAHLRYIIYYGKDRSKYDSELSQVDIVITSYGTLTSSVNNSSLSNNKWLRIVLDEAHVIKNHRSKTHMEVSRLSSRYRWLLTGTPIHNCLNDLYSLVKFLKFAPFDDKTCWSKYFDKHVRRKEFTNLLSKILILRRTKTDSRPDGTPLIKLPKKIEITHSLKLSSPEKLKYVEIHEKLKKEILKCLFNSCKNNTNPDSIRSYGHAFIMLLRLQQACCHFHLLKDKIKTDDQTIKETEVDDLISVFENLGINSKTSKDHHDSDDIFGLDFKSSKISKLLEIIEGGHNNLKEDELSKSVIVSQWTNYLDLIKHHLKIQGYSYDTISGSVPAHQRQEIVFNFNNTPKPQILLLSLKAGGVGLNLIGAKSLIIMDQHWNPALEQQACDRIYRVGQKKDVFIHKFITQDTVEERISKLKDKKLKLASEILDKNNSEVYQKLTKDDLKSLLNINDCM